MPFQRQFTNEEMLCRKAEPSQEQMQRGCGCCTPTSTVSPSPPLQPANPHPQPSFGQPVRCIRMGFQCPSAPPLLGGVEDVGTAKVLLLSGIFSWKKEKTPNPQSQNLKEMMSLLGYQHCSQLGPFSSLPQMRRSAVKAELPPALLYPWAEGYGFSKALLLSLSHWLKDQMTKEGDNCSWMWIVSMRN